MLYGVKRLKRKLPVLLLTFLVLAAGMFLSLAGTAGRTLETDPLCAAAEEERPQFSGIAGYC